MARRGCHLPPWLRVGWVVLLVWVTPAPAIDPEAPFASHLSAYGFFIEGDPRQPAPKVYPYRLNTPHFADHCPLERFLFVPQGKSIEVDSDGGLVFPAGAVLILNVFSPPGWKSEGNPHGILETRLMAKSALGWRFAVYLWAPQESEATLSQTGGELLLQPLDPTGGLTPKVHHVPNINQCGMCHEIEDAVIPLGPSEIRNLSTEGGDLLERLKDHAALAGTIPESRAETAFPVWNDPATGSLDSRARAYLDVNCSSCHRPGGLAYTSGLDLRYDQSTPVKYGVFKSPVAAGRGVGKARFGIVPGHPDESILLHRLASTDPGIRMPVVGRSLVHEEGVALIREWIASMDMPDGPLPDNIRRLKDLNLYRPAHPPEESQ